MATVWEAAKNALTGLGLPMAANTYLAEGTDGVLPDTFLVYQAISEPSLQSANDAETLKWRRMQVTYFSRAGLAGMPGIAAAMAAGGFRRMDGRELPYSRETRHFGYAMDFSYLEEV